MYDACKKCGGRISPDDIGLYRRLIDRTANSGFICISCMAEHFRCDIKLLERKAEEYKKSGCIMFPQS